MTKKILTHCEMYNLAHDCAKRIFSGVSLPRGPLYIYGVPRGGVPAAYLIVSMLNKLYPAAHAVCCECPEAAHAIVDDIVDSGATAERYKQQFPDTPFFSLTSKGPDWQVFPWEQGLGDTDESITDNVTRVLQYIGEDPEREGLKETPTRVVKAWGEWFSGYTVDVKSLFRTFTDGAEKFVGDEMVIQNGIPVYSHCEHHMAPIVGHAHVAYIPNGKIIGLSKIARVVNAYMRRLQVQERLTNQIADSFVENLDPKGVGVIIKARHMCMESRGVNICGSVTTTSALRGLLLDNPAAKAEFVELVGQSETRR